MSLPKHERGRPQPEAGAVPKIADLDDLEHRTAAQEARRRLLEHQRKRKPRGCITNERGDLFLPGVRLGSSMERDVTLLPRLRRVGRPSMRLRCMGCRARWREYLCRAH